MTMSNKLCMTNDNSNSVYRHCRWIYHMPASCFQYIHKFAIRYNFLIESQSQVLVICGNEFAVSFSFSQIEKDKEISGRKTYRECYKWLLYIYVQVRRWTLSMTCNYYIESTKYQTCWLNVWNIFFACSHKINSIFDRLDITHYTHTIRMDGLRIQRNYSLKK